MKRHHSMPFGAEFVDEDVVRFRLWAPKARHVDLLLDDRLVNPMPAVGDGWFELIQNSCRPGSLYKFQIDGGARVPDPASRFQPADVHGPSEVIAAGAFDWQDGQWLGRPWEETVLYELHVGTFTPQGTFSGVEQKLDYLVELGVTAVELMPVADFPGARNWGYDGVLPFAPDAQYGGPEDLKHLIQSAHAKGLMMFLDVVYNHFGAEGNYLHEYAPQFFTDRHRTPWGKALNFDGPDSRPVREFFVHNALYWLSEFHFDGLRLDAVHAIVDNSSPSVLIELAETVRSRIDRRRQIHLVLENDDNCASYLKRAASGRPNSYSAQWNEDIHHSLHVAITGEHDGYYADYADCAVQHLERCLRDGFDYQGQPSGFREGRRRGEPCADLPPTAFVSFLQNHDQVGNRAFGERIVKLAEPQALRAAMATLLLAPSPPLLFMGEEFGANTPFLFFCDFEPGLAKAVTEGRRNEFARFTLGDWREPSGIPDPSAKETFERSKLNWQSLHQTEHTEWLEFYRHLLRLRRWEIASRPWRAVTGEFRAFECQGLLAQWRADSTTLTLITNLSGGVLRAIPRPPGDLLYCSESDCAISLETVEVQPWSTLWLLKR